MTELWLVFQWPRFWWESALLFSPCPASLLQYWRDTGAGQGPLRPLLVTLQLYYTAYIFVSGENSKSSSKIQLWGSSCMHFSQIWLSARTQHKKGDVEIHKTVPHKGTESALKLGKTKSRWKNNSELARGIWWKYRLTNGYIYFKKTSRGSKMAHILEVENIARNNICDVTLYYLGILNRTYAYVRTEL